MKPMRAAACSDLSKIRFPCYAQPKIDGIRCIVKGGVAYTNSLKEIPNSHIKNKLKEFSSHFPGVVFDGELVSGNFQTTTSAVMTQDGEPSFEYCVFDIINDDVFKDRNNILTVYWLNLANYHNFSFVNISPTILCHSSEQLERWVKNFDERGYEGTMVRCPNSRYKFGRSTLKEQALLKIKNFTDDEAMIVGFEEELKNLNEATTNNLGLTERSSHKENLIGKGSLGAFIVNSSNKEFKIGSGFTAQQRKEFWLDREKLLGRFVKFKYFEYGVKNLPRHPVFLGFRDKLDMPIG